MRLPQVLDWLDAQQPDILALQETKLTDPDFPISDIATIGYQAVFSGQKTYNGVAILSRLLAEDVCIGLPGMDDPQRRVLTATIGDVRLLNLYVPNGQAVGSEKYAYKLAWLEKLTTWLHHELMQHSRLVVAGDFNIAPEDRDVYDPVIWDGRILCSVPERAAFQQLLALGLKDSFRLFVQEENAFSWWDYRAAAFCRNRGLRIDHILASPELATACVACYVDKVPRHLPRPSDHAPVIAEFEFN